MSYRIKTQNYPDSIITNVRGSYEDLIHLFLDAKDALKTKSNKVICDIHHMDWGSFVTDEGSVIFGPVDSNLFKS